MTNERYTVETVSPPEWKGGMNCYVIDTHEGNMRLDGCHMTVASAQRTADLLNGLEANAEVSRKNLAERETNRRIARIENRKFEDMRETVELLDSLYGTACMDASNIGARFLLHAKNHVDAQIDSYLRGQGK